MGYKDKRVAALAYKIYNEQHEKTEIILPFETEGCLYSFHRISNPAGGYFNSLDDLHLEAFVVT